MPFFLPPIIIYYTPFAMRILKSFLLIINYKTFVITALSLIATWICHRNHWIADFPLILISTAIVFPIVFSINSAYKRRESALQQFSNIKGSAIAMYCASRDWVSASQNPVPEKLKVEFREMLVAMRSLFYNNVEGHSLHAKEKIVYTHFNRISQATQELRDVGLNSSEISRVNQYLSKIIIAFDAMRNIADYRTPITLRAYSKGFIYSFPILYGPYFAYTIKDYGSQLGYVMPILYSFILVSLDNIQDHLEDPFDEVGEDDIQINIEEIMDLMHNETEIKK